MNETMEFCEELAVLQSALMLAEKECSSNLLSINKYACKTHKAFEVIQFAVKEIIRGLPLQGHVQGHWEKKLPVLLFSSLFHHGYSEQTDEMASLQDNPLSIALTAFPRFSKHLYFELVKRNGWNNILTQILSVMEAETCRKVIIEILKHVNENTDSQDVTLFIDVCRLICKHPLQFLHLFENDQSIEHTPVENESITFLLGQGLQLLNKHGTILEDAVDVLLGMMNLVNLLLFQSASSLVQNPAFPDIRNQKNIYRRLEELLNNSVKNGNIEHNSNHMSNLHDCGVSTHYHVYNEVKLDETERFKDKALALMEKFYHILEGDSSLINEMEAALKLKGITNVEKLDDSNRNLIWKLSMSHSTFKNFCRNLSCYLSAGATGDIEWMSGLNNMCNEINAGLEHSYRTVSANLQRMNEEDRFSGYLRRVNSRQTDIAAVKWLLSSPEVKSKYIYDPRWIDCLAKNTSCIFPLENVTQLIALLEFTRNNDSASLYDQLKEVVMRSLCNLSLDEQNQLVQIVHQSYDCSQLFRVNNDTMTQLTSIFNQLTDSKDRLQLIASKVTQMALQCPERTVQKAFQEAVTRAGQISHIVKILGHLPWLCRRQSEHSASMSVLISAINHGISQSDLNQKEENNLMEFLTLLLQESDKHSIPALPVEDLVNHCALPYLGADKTTKEGSLILLRHSLRILQLSLNVQDTDTRGRLFRSIQLIPLVLSLCQIINEFRILGDNAEDSCEDIETIKLLAVHSLIKIASSMDKKDDKEIKKGLSWLLKRLKAFHWSCAVYLFPLLKESGSISSYQQLIPSQLKNFINNKEETSKNPKQDLLQLQLLVEFASIDDKANYELLESLVSSHCTVDTDQYPVLLVSLTQVFPLCIQEGWQRLCGFLCQLIQKNHISVPIRHTFSGTPPDNLTPEVKVQISMVQIVFDVLMLLKKSQTEVKSAQWRHLARCCIIFFKNLYPQREDSTSDNDDSFLLHQMLCHVTYLASCLPITAAEQMVVMALDLGKRYKASWEHSRNGCTKSDFKVIHSVLNRWTDSKEKELLKNELAKCVTE